MFVVMFVVLALADRAVGGLGFAASMGLVLLIAFGYPLFARAVGLAPPVWER
jgi:hypothetical protein